MKKIIVLIMVLLVVTIIPAICEGKIIATQKNLYVFDNDDNGYFFARIENTGDAPIAFDDANLVIFDDNDEIIVSESYISPAPSHIILNPGEYTYVKDFLWDSKLENAKIGDVKFSVASKDSGSEVKFVPSSSSFDLDNAKPYNNYVYITFTNESEETRYNYYVISALLDEEGNVLFVDRNNYDNLGVHPNSTITLKMHIDGDLVDHYKAHGLTPTVCDSQVYYIIDD